MNDWIKFIGKKKTNIIIVKDKSKFL